MIAKFQLHTIVIKISKYSRNWFKLNPFIYLTALVYHMHLWGSRQIFHICMTICKHDILPRICAEQNAIKCFVWGYLISGMRFPVPQQVAASTRAAESRIDEPRKRLRRRVIVIDLAQRLTSLWAVCQLRSGLTHVTNIKQWRGEMIYMNGIKRLYGQNVSRKSLKTHYKYSTISVCHVL